VFSRFKFFIRFWINCFFYW